MSKPNIGKVDWQVLDRLPVIHRIQFFCDAMSAAGRFLPKEARPELALCQIKSEFLQIKSIGKAAPFLI